MANEQLIDQVISPVVDEQVASLNKMLKDLDIQMVKNIATANTLNAATGNVKSFKELNAAQTQSALNWEKVQQAQNKTTESALKLNSAQDKFAQAEAVRQAKAISDQQKRDAAQAVSDAKQIAAAEAKAAKLAEIERKSNIQFPASQNKPNPVTDEPAPGQGAVRYEPVITGQEDMALKATKSTEALSAENVVLLEQQEVLNSLSVAQRANIENLLALQVERAANAAELKQLNVQDAVSGERAVFLTAEQLRLKVAIAEVTLELNRQTKEMILEGGSVKELQVSLDLLRESYYGLSVAERESASGQKMLTQVNLLDAEVKKLKGSTGDTSKEIGAYEKAIAKATSGTQLATQAITIATRSVVRMIVQFALFGVVLEGVKWLYEWIKALDIFNPIATEAEQRQKALVDAFSSGNYTKGLEDIEKLKANLDLAKDGFADSSSVIDEYNQTIGKTFGYVDTLTQAQQGFIDNSKDYIKAIYLEAAAQLNLAEAAKFAAETEVKNQKLRNEIEDLARDRSKTANNPRAIAFSKILSASDEQEIKNNEKREDEFFANSLKTNEHFYKELDEIKKKHGVKGGENKVSDIDTLENQIQNERLERQKLAAQNLIGNDKLSYATRIKAVNDYYVASKQIADNNEKLATNKVKLSADQKLDIEQKYSNSVLQLQQARDNQLKSLHEKQYKQDQEILKNNIEKQKDLFKQVSEDPNQSYSMKLIALDIYNKKSQDLIEANYKEQLKEAGKNGESIKLAEQAKDKAFLQLSNETSATRIKITKEEVSKVLEASKESEQAQLESLQNALKISEKALSDARNDAEDKLAEQLAKREISQRKHDRRLLAINDEYNVALLAQEITAQQAIIAIKEGQRDKNISLLKLDGASQEDINKAQSAGDKDVQGSKDTLAELIDKFNKAKSKQKTDAAKPDKDDHRAEIYGLQQTMRVVDDLDKLRQKAYENEISRLENLKQQVDDNANAEKEAVNNSIASSATKAREIAVIDARANAQKKAIQADENRIKQKEAITEKEAAISKIILETAIAAIKAPAELGPILGLAAVPIVLALGAVELAAAIAAPIPKFAQGGTTPGGLILWGEAGMESARLPDGTVRYSNGPTLEALPRGTEITPHMQLMQRIRPEEVRYAGGEQVGWKEVLHQLKKMEPKKSRNRFSVNVDMGYENYKRSYLTR